MIKVEKYITGAYGQYYKAYCEQNDMQVIFVDNSNDHTNILNSAIKKINEKKVS